MSEDRFHFTNLAIIAMFQCSLEHGNCRCIIAWQSTLSNMFKSIYSIKLSAVVLLMSHVSGEWLPQELHFTNTWWIENIQYSRISIFMSSSKQKRNYFPTFLFRMWLFLSFLINSIPFDSWAILKRIAMLLVSAILWHSPTKHVLLTKIETNSWFRFFLTFFWIFCFFYYLETIKYVNTIDLILKSNWTSIFSSIYLIEYVCVFVCVFLCKYNVSTCVLE